MRETTRSSTARVRFSRLLLGAGMVVGSLILGTVTQVGLRAQGDFSEGGGQHVLLRNGQVISGKVTNLGDRMLIVLPSGGEVNLPTKDVLLTCQSLPEAYEFLAERIEGRRTIEPFIELARWSLRHDLLEQAEGPLAKAREMDPKHASLPVLARQLDRAKRQAALPPGTLPSAQVAASRPLTAGEDSPRSPSSAARSVRTHPPTMEELEKTVQAIPREGVELFVNTIQPMMWNKCGTNRCHDVGGPSEFRVLRPANGKQVWRRLSLRNLHTLLGYVDQEDPEASLLLRKSRTSHGDASVPPLGSEDSIQYQQLLIWVEGVARRQGGLARTSRPDSGTSDGTEQQLPMVSRASFDSPLAKEEFEEVQQEEVAERSRKASARGGSDRDNENGPYQPRDPFDPEVFNRKHLRR
jgi:hypothetical protein